MSYTRRENPNRRPSHLKPVDPPRAIAHDAHAGLPELLFTGLTAVVFLLLMASVAAAAILYSQGA